MIYIEAPGTEPEFNLALEEYIFESLPREESYFMLWQNENAVIVGKNQNTETEINQTYVEEHHVHVVRRLSGGGAVYHDLGNLNYTFITDAQNTEQINLHIFSEAVAKALHTLGVNAAVNGRNDITIEGKKFSGNAQYIKAGRIMHHGTIMFDSDLKAIACALCVTRDKLAGNGTDSIRSRVTNVRSHLKKDMSLEEFKKHLLNEIFQEEKIISRAFSREEICAVMRIRDAKYGTWNWNYGESPSCTLKKEKRIDGCGKIEAYLQMDKGIIRKLQFFGDYFGLLEAEEIAESLAGARLERQELRCRLSNFNISQYFLGCDEEALVTLLLS